MRRRPKDPKRKFICLGAFGIGLLVACFCPPKILVIILAVAVILLGATGSKC